MMKQGVIFNIQKFSIHDGPGIRTTVFFKGCPLRCTWCSNPESQISDIQILHDESKCVHCLTCMSNCPALAINYVNDKIVIDPKQCVGCLSCVNSCVTKALSYEGENKSVDEIVKVCLQDKDFYEESHGGVTISGGEGMAQPEFLKELVHQLHEEKLHVAIETTGYVEPELFSELAIMFDLLLFDVKHYDCHKHYEGTHVYNDVILENLKWANDHQLEILPRIPVIPGFNASIEDAHGFADLLLSLSIQKVQLLPFHQFGEKKYDLLKRDYQFKNKKALYPEDLKAYQKVFLDKGIDCFF